MFEVHETSKQTTLTFHKLHELSEDARFRARGIAVYFRWRAGRHPSAGRTEST